MTRLTYQKLCQRWYYSGAFRPSTFRRSRQCSAHLGSPTNALVLIKSLALFLLSTMTVMSTTTTAFTATSTINPMKATTTMWTMVDSFSQDQQVELPSQLVSVYMKPASEHTQSWFGSSDPYLSAGKSIAPTSKALSDMGITITDKANLLLNDPSVSSINKDAPSSTKYIIDSTFIQHHTLLPGFAPTRGILDPSLIDSNSIDAPPAAVSFVATIDWASHYINIIDKIPIVVLFYVCIEFFILRPNINLYKEDIDENPMGTFVNTVTVTSVRLAMFFILTIFTVGVFG